MKNVKQILPAGLFFLLGGIGIWSYNISTNTATSVATDVSTSVATDVVANAMEDVVDDIALVATDVSKQVSNSVATEVTTEIVANVMNDRTDDLVNRVTSSLAENNSINVESNLDIEEIFNVNSEIISNGSKTSCKNIKFEIGSFTEPDGITYKQRCEMLNRFIDNIRSTGSVCDRVSYFDVYVDADGIEKSWTLKCNNKHFIHEYRDGNIESITADELRKNREEEQRKNSLILMGLLGSFLIFCSIRYIQ